jgi:hypothetical protein
MVHSPWSIAIEVWERLGWFLVSGSWLLAASFWQLAAGVLGWD